MTTWQDIATAPRDEAQPFLVLMPGNDVCDSLIAQVTYFEGGLYQDAANGLIDWGDRVTTATHWMPCPELPK